MAVAELSKIKTSVPGQYLGYGLQPVRLCLHALTAPTECSVSLEYLDDVAIQYPDGSVVLEQTKSALKGNPTSDRSKELWKALANWAELCVLGTVDVNKAVFRYYVTPSRSGELIKKLHEVDDEVAALELLTCFKSKKFRGKQGIGIEPEIARFLAAGDELCLAIIHGFEFVTESNPLGPIQSRLAVVLAEETVDDFCAAAIGMVKDEVEALIREQKPPIFSVAKFRKKFRAFIKKYDFSNLLIPTMKAPTSEEVEAVIGGLPTFVRQLTSIDASETVVTIAVGDYLRAASDKVNWAADGDIVESSLDELDRALVRHHSLGLDEISDTCSHLTPQERGRRLYRKCIELSMHLEGRELPSYFIPGEFNALSEDCRLGWHPDYESLFPSES